MANLPASPDGLARRLFVLVMLGVFGYVTAVVVLMSSSDDPHAQQAGVEEGALAQRAP